MAVYTTIDEIIYEIITVLGGYAGHFDVDGIARDVAEWRDGRLCADLERPDFWEVVEAHELA